MGKTVGLTKSLIDERKKKAAEAAKSAKSNETGKDNKKGKSAEGNGADK